MVCVNSQSTGYYNEPNIIHVLTNHHLSIYQLYPYMFDSQNPMSSLIVVEKH